MNTDQDYQYPGGCGAVIALAVMMAILAYAIYKIIT